MKKIMLMAVAAMMAMGMSAQEAGQKVCMKKAGMQKCQMEQCQQKCHQKAAPMMLVDAQSRAMQDAAKLKQELLLNESQCDKVYAVLLESNKKMDASRKAFHQQKKEQELTEEQVAAHKAEMKKLHDELNGKMKKVLNEEQFKKWTFLQHQGHKGPKPVQKQK